MREPTLAGILVRPAVPGPPPAADVVRRVEMAQLAASALELRLLWLGGQYAGYLALVPGATGFAHLSVYLTPEARCGGRGWRFCRELAGWCASAGAGLHAVAVHPLKASQGRLCRALGYEPAGYLPPRGPVFVVARLDATGRALPAEDIARLALPLSFAASDALAPAYRSAGLTWKGSRRTLTAHEPRAGQGDARNCQ